MRDRVEAPFATTIEGSLSTNEQEFSGRSVPRAHRSQIGWHTDSNCSTQAPSPIFSTNAPIVSSLGRSFHLCAVVSSPPFHPLPPFISSLSFHFKIGPEQINAHFSVAPPPSLLLGQVYEDGSANWVTAGYVMLYTVTVVFTVLEVQSRHEEGIRIASNSLQVGGAP